MSNKVVFTHNRPHSTRHPMTIVTQPLHLALIAGSAGELTFGVYFSLKGMLLSFWLIPYFG